MDSRQSKRLYSTYMYQNTPQRGPQKHTFLEGPLFKWMLKGRVCYYKNVNKIYHRNANNYVIICVVVAMEMSLMK